MPAMPEPDFRSASAGEVTVGELYALLRLRVDVFVVEQECPYPELDGRDLEPATRHVWAVDGVSDTPAAYLRVLDEPDGSVRIGRVCTRRDRRGAGLAADLMRTTLRQLPARRVVLDAQSRLRHWYERLGFAVDGPEFVEDGIPHLPMVLAGSWE
jgi:ElaA protein